MTVVCGETGSGKTTQLPKICLDIGRGVAGVLGLTQPRRIAARTVVWAAGVAGAPLARGLPVDCDGAGRIVVQGDLSVPGRCPRAASWPSA